MFCGLTGRTYIICLIFAEVLSKYQMVTIEKWYTACGSLHPIQAGPECNVERAMYITFGQIKALNPNITTILYINTMFDFSMYHLDAMAQQLEQQGTRVLLRDKVCLSR